MAKSTSAKCTRKPFTLSHAGIIIVQLFLGTDINPDSSHKLAERRFCIALLPSVRKLFAYSVLCLILMFFIVDIVDLFFRGTMRDVSYGKVNAIITMIGFSSSQVCFFQAGASILIVVHRSNLIKVCLNYISSAQVDKSTVKPTFNERLRRWSYVFYGLVLMSGICSSIFGIQAPVIMLSHADGLYPYSLFRFPIRPLKYYLYFAQYFTTVVNFSFVLLIYSITMLLYECAGDMNRRLALTRTGTKDFQTVHALRYDYETFLDCFSVAQKALGELLLVEAVIPGVQLMIVLSWFCTWISVPETGDPLRACTMGFSGIGAVIVLCVTMYGPIRLSSMRKELTENAEKLSEYHQKASKITMSVGEMDFLDSFMRRIRLHSLTFVAGEVLHLNVGAVIKGIFFLVGFFCYIVERIENSSSFDDLVGGNVTSGV